MSEQLYTDCFDFLCVGLYVCDRVLSSNSSTIKKIMNIKKDKIKAAVYGT